MRHFQVIGRARVVPVALSTLLLGVLAVIGILAFFPQKSQAQGEPRIVVTTAADRNSRLGPTIAALQRQGYTISEDLGRFPASVGTNTRAVVLTPSALRGIDRAAAQAAYRRGTTVAALDVPLPDLLVVVDPKAAEDGAGGGQWAQSRQDFPIFSIITRLDSPAALGFRQTSDYLYSPEVFLSALTSHVRSRDLRTPTPGGSTPVPGGPIQTPAPSPPPQGR